MHSRPRSPISGFTLIELLTVIAIIGILAAIIIPVVGKVRQSARHTQNVSNLRQITVGNLTYHEDNRRFASGNDWEVVDGANVRSWAQRISKYCGTTPQSFVNGQLPPGVFAFPDSTAFKGSATDNNYNHAINQGSSGSYTFYSRNNTIYVNNSHVAAGNSVASLNRIRHPARLYMVSDWNHWDTWGVNNTTMFPGYFGGKYTVGFADGHVKSYRAGTLPGANPGGQNYDITFWDARAQ